jgi:hypothetical protein
MRKPLYSLVHCNGLILNLLFYRRNAANAWLPVVQPILSSTSSSALATPNKWSPFVVCLAAAKKDIHENEENDAHDDIEKNQPLPKQRKKRRTWDESFQLLKEYILTNGNSPSRWKDDPYLWPWVCRQRVSRDRLSDAQRNALDSIGFDWDPNGAAWNEQFQKLLLYKQKFGDCNVPSRWKDDPDLWPWFARQRLSRDRLSDAQRNAMNDIGFVWDPHGTAWSEQYQKLLLMKLKFGVCYIPWEWDEDPALAEWVRNLRFSYASLPEAQRKDLNDIGFNWDQDEAKWRKNYEKLILYKNRFGDCLVPRQWEEDPSLGEWVATQRALWYSSRRVDKDYSGCRLEEHRWMLLDQLDFDWNHDEPIIKK